MPLDYVGLPNPSLDDVSLEMFDTRLKAVNLCLYSTGYAPVESENTGDIDAADALGVVSRISQNLQYNSGKGWWFNLEPDWRMTPDSSNGQITLPNNVLSAWQDVRNDELKRNIVVRGRMLYDMNNHTYDMTACLNNEGYIRMAMIVNLPFEQLPVSVRQAVGYQSVVEFMVAKDFDQNKMQVWMQAAQRMQIAIESESASQTSLNMFVNNPTQAHFGAMAGGPNALAAFSRNPYNGYGGYVRKGGRR